MPVFKGSRYEGVRFTGILGKDGKVRRFLHPREPLRIEDLPGPTIVHAFQAGDQLDALAHRVAGKSRLWWVLGDVNHILFPLDLPGNTELVVPVRELRERSEFGGT